MAVVDSTKKEINIKIVYYGPARSGKTTSIQQLQNKLEAKKKSKVSHTPQTEHTLFFDFLALSSDSLGGYKTRFQVYTVPGQPIYEHSRQVLLKGVDGLIFVADSQLEKIEDNLKSFDELKSQLKLLGCAINEIPLVLQYNKRDISNKAPLDELRKAVNLLHVPDFETVATKGDGVVEAFKECVKQVLMSLKNAHA